MDGALWVVGEVFPFFLFFRFLSGGGGILQKSNVRGRS